MYETLSTLVFNFFIRMKVLEVFNFLFVSIIFDCAEARDGKNFQLFRLKFDLESRLS